MLPPREAQLLQLVPMPVVYQSAWSLPSPNRMIREPSKSPDTAPTTFPLLTCVAVPVSVLAQTVPLAAV